MIVLGEYDECGVCNGDGIANGACDCDGNVDDCAGECGGSAVVDECDVCGGDGSSCGDDGGACDDVDEDGICDDIDDCVGEYDECGVCNGDGIADGTCDCDGNVDDCAGECGGSAVVDECDVCGGDGSSCGDDGGNIDGGCNLPENNFYLVDGEVLYNSTVDIGGFQFDVDGATVTGASGGDAAVAGFTVSSGGSTVLAFSFTGATIPAGCGTLVNLSLDGEPSGLINIVVSDAVGNGVDFSYYDGGSDDGGTDDGGGDDGGTDDGGDDGGADGSIIIVEDGIAESGTQASVFVSLTNDEAIGGFQFVLSDIPDVLSYVEVLTTDRTVDFTVSAAEGEGGVTLLGFSFTGAVIDIGDGPIAEIIYNVNFVEFDTSVDIGLSGSILSDPFGAAVNHSTLDGNLAVSAGELMAPSTPTGLIANGGQNSVSLSWNSTWQATEYTVWRDGNVIDNVSSTSYTDPGLDNETEYCYQLTASNSEGTSDSTSAVCATTLPEYTGPPVISVGSVSVNAGDSFDIDVSLANPGDAVAGVQLQILDSPNHLSVANVVGTDRIAGFELSFNEQADGSVLILAFSLTGQIIAPGTGPIVIIDYLSTTPYEAVVSLDVSDSILSDSQGIPIEHNSEGGVVNISGEEPPPEAPDTPTGLVASEGDSQVLVSWNSSFGASEYYVYRESQTGGGTDGGNTDGGNTDGGGTDGGQGDCDDGYLMDCSGDGDCCPESWIGDGFEDCEDQQWGCDLTCYDNDGGDCSGGTTGGGTTGGGSEDCSSCEFDWTAYGSECCDTAWAEFGITCSELESTYYWDCSGCACAGDLANNGNHNFDENIENWDGNIQIADVLNREEYIPFNFENNREYELISVVESTDYLDIEVLNGVNYCYYVVASNISGDSGNSNIDCAEPFGLNAPANLVATGEVGNIYLEWTAPPNTDDGGGTDGGGTDGGGDVFIDCPDGSAEYADCIGTCFNNEDCANTTYDGCIEGNSTWLGDGYCDDGAWGLVFQCDEYGNDCGDCGTLNDPFGACGGTADDGGTDGGGDDGGTGSCEEDCPDGTYFDGWSCYDCSYCLTISDDSACDAPDDCCGQCGGSVDGDCGDTDGGGTDDGGTDGGTGDCDGSGGLSSWISDGYCDSINNISECGYDGGDCCPGDCVDSTYDCATYGGTCDDCFDPNSSDNAPGGQCDDGFSDDGGTDGGTDGGQGSCEDGYVEDCSGDGDCCPESWIADGFEDCEDQAFGCDLTCYDNDGGDCSGGTTGGGSEDCSSCEFDFTAYGS